jgi:hypothetical protein
MNPTVFIYSSHDRCEYLHREYIIQPALASHDNKTIFHIPMSEALHNQHIDYGKFAAYYERFQQYGLAYSTFYWSEQLKTSDAEIFFARLAQAQVVVLGGGESFIGMPRFRALGERFFHDPDRFGRILHERQAHGLMTVGFSAGADELGQYLAYDQTHSPGFGLARNIVTSLHIEPGRLGELAELAGRYRHCLAFGLPNDAGLAITQGFLPSGNIWQVICCAIDCSWDRPEDQWHIKTKQGVRIEHHYHDGRRWTFNGGDMLIRVFSADNDWQDITIVTPQGQHWDYWKQQPIPPRSLPAILAKY